MSIVRDLYERKLIQPPKFVAETIAYECIMGSYAYGTSSENSDTDVRGFCIPPKSIVFPHTAGVIFGFDKEFQKFTDWQQHHVIDIEKNREVDLELQSIIKFFALCMDGNPSLIDTAFVPGDCITHCTGVGRRMRDARKLFLHKGAYHRFRGFAHEMLHKLEIKKPKDGSARHELVQKFGWDVKFGAHAVRLMLEAEQILRDGDLDLRANAATLIAIRNGEWTHQQLREVMASKEKELEDLYTNSTAVPYGPDVDAIKTVLVECLEDHFGNLANAYEDPGAERKALDQISVILQSVQK